MVEVFSWQTLEKRNEQQRFRRQGRRAYNRLAWGLVLLLLGQTLFPVLISALLQAAMPWLHQDANVRLVLTYGCMYLISFPLLCLLWGGLPDRLPSLPLTEDENLSVGRFLGLYAMLMTLANLTLWILNWVAGLLGDGTQESLQELGESDASPWLLFFLAVIVAPVMEELVFRYLPYQKAAGYGMRYFVVWTAISFGLFHLNVMQGAYACVMGLVFAIVMYRTGDVRYCIGLHMLVNASSAMGLGGLLLRGENERLLGLYSLFQLILFVIGIVLLARYINEKYLNLTDDYKTGNICSFKRVFATPGYLCFLSTCLFFMALYIQ